MGSKSNHVAILLPDMGGGGAERLTLDLIDGFLKRGAQVDLVLQARRGPLLDLVPPDVRIIDLAQPRLRRLVRPLRRYLKQQRPDAMLAAMWPLTTVAVLAAAGLTRRPRLVLAEHCSLAAQYAAQPAANRAMRASIWATYRFSAAIVSVSAALGAEIATLAGRARSKIKTIWNPVPAPMRSAQPADWGLARGPRILSVGALKPQKNHAGLIRAFEKFQNTQHGNAVLAIVGDGPERASLERLVDRLGLRGKVLLPGFTLTPGDWYASADLFVLNSTYEGFGNVLVEALHSGLTVIATDCPHGPSEVLGAGAWGTLVPVGDEAALAAAMADALAHPADRSAQMVRADIFSVERAVTAYWRVLFE